MTYSAYRYPLPTRVLLVCARVLSALLLGFVSAFSPAMLSEAHTKGHDFCFKEPLIASFFILSHNRPLILFCNIIQPCPRKPGRWISRHQLPTLLLLQQPPIDASAVPLSHQLHRTSGDYTGLPRPRVVVLGSGGWACHGCHR